MKHLELISKKTKIKSVKNPIIFIHGACHDAYCWNEYFLEYFAEHNIDSYALTLSGRGSSRNGKALHTIGIDNFVSDVKLIAENFDKNPILIGHSMGGFIAQKYAQQHGVAGLILMNSVPPSGVFFVLFKLFSKHPLNFFKACLTLNLKPFISNSEISSKLFLSNNVDHKVKSKFTNMLHNESFKALYDMSFKTLKKNERNGYPILVIGSEQDNVISSEIVSKTAKYYKHSTLEIFKEMGHDMMLEKKWKNVADYIINWLNKNL